MGLLDKLFGRKNKVKEANASQQSPAMESTPVNKRKPAFTKRGVVSAHKIQMDDNAWNAIGQRYIAFDVETTGLSAERDRIIEVGAVIFENGIPVDKFGTLVNAMVRIPSAATAVNHITDQMIANAPSEREVYAKLIEFLGDALTGATAICAHNARFDMDFLSETLERLGYDAEIYYIDTLSLSRSMVKGLENYKQNTVATHFDLVNQNAHRAESDAEICGSILWNLLGVKRDEQEKNRIAMEKSRPSDEEREVCAVIQNIIASRNGNIDLLGFYKNSNGYVDVCYLYNIIKFKFAKKGKYIIVANNLKATKSFTKEPCTMTEGGSDYVRVFFSSPLDIEILGDYIFKEYKAISKSALDYLKYDRSFIGEYKNGPIMNNAMSMDDVNDILDVVRSKDYQVQNVAINEEIIDRASVEIHPINSRASLSEIKNLDNWDKGFDQGFPFWEKGDELRKAGDIEASIELFDKARFQGYCAPVLFESYAKAYHKLKDYDNEIDILDEGIARESKQGTNISRMVARRDTAIKMLLKQREKEQNAKERLEKKQKQTNLNSEKSNGREQDNKQTGRPILQLDDDMNVISRFESVAEAVRKTGINSKSIRDAAKGKQKHAGNFVWRYEEEYESK